MGRMVTHAITVKGVIYGTAYVSCSEDDHHPEKLIDEVDWNTGEIEWHDIVDDDIVDSWEDEESNVNDDST